MARDLFRDVAFRSPSVRSRRSPVVVVSVAAHAARGDRGARGDGDRARHAADAARSARVLRAGAIDRHPTTPPPPAPRPATAPPAGAHGVAVRGASRRSPIDRARNMGSGFEPSSHGVANGIPSGLGNRRRRRASMRRRPLLSIRRPQSRSGCTAGSGRRKRSSTYSPPIRKSRESRGLKAWSSSKR